MRWRTSNQRISKMVLANHLHTRLLPITDMSLIAARSLKAKAPSAVAHSTQNPFRVCTVVNKVWGSSLDWDLYPYSVKLALFTTPSSLLFAGFSSLFQIDHTSFLFTQVWCFPYPWMILEARQWIGRILENLKRVRQGSALSFTVIRRVVWSNVKNYREGLTS